MSTSTQFPPTKHHGSRQISQNEAQRLLASFLEEAATKPHMQPNARLTEGGPTSLNADSSQGLTLHNLHRVEAGLRGEKLGVDPSLRQYGGKGLNARQGQARDEHGEAEDESMGVTGWQDKADFEREQEDEVGEIGSRTPALPSLDDMKEQRKQKKRARRKEEKRAKNQG